MRRAFNWMGACTVLAFAVFVASCDDGPMEAPEQASVPTVTETAAPSLDVGILATDVWGDCLNEDADDPPDGTRFNNATCTANDVEIKVLEALEVNGEPVPDGGTVTCTEGEELAVKLRAYFGLNAEERYDIAYFLAEDGGDARIGDCFHDFLDPIDKGGLGDPTGGPPYLGPFADYEADDALDVCGDAAEDDEVLIPGIVDPIAAVKEVPQLITIICQDDDDDGFVEIGTCTSWDNNDKDTCEGVEDAFPGTPSKCNCRPAQLPINVKRSATVKVIKDVKYDGGETGVDDSKWTLTIASPSLTSDETDNVGDDGFIEIEIEWFRDDEPGVNKATVTEAYFSDGAGSGDFYNSTYSCNSTNDAHDVASTSGRSIPEFTDLVNDESIVCTFVNDRIPPPTVTTTKDATETFDRAWAWLLTKDVYLNGATSPAEVCSTLGADIDGVPQALQLGQLLTVCYVVDATRTGPTDTGHNVSGTINVVVGASTAPYVGSFTVTDEIDPGDIAASWVDCDGTAGAPYEPTKTGVQPGSSFSCTYSADLTQVQAEAATTNTATASVTWNTGDQGGDDGSAAVSFGDEDINSETDETADVTDTWHDQPNFNLELALATSKTFTFDRDLSCPDYGDFLIENDAFLTSVDGGYNLTDNADVPISCPQPPSGCTLTQGFWRTHSQFGPAPYSDGWAYITPDGANTEFSEGFDWVINSEMTYYQVLWDPGKGGNAWFKLGHQYIAAQLNILNGADGSLIATYMADAQSILDWYDADSNPDNSIPKRGTDWCAGDGGSGACTAYNSDRQYAMYLNNKLTQYNEGTLPGGPMHCDDDAQSLYGVKVE